MHDLKPLNVSAPVDDVHNEKVYMGMRLPVSKFDIMAYDISVIKICISIFHANI